MRQREKDGKRGYKANVNTVSIRPVIVNETERDAKEVLTHFIQ